MTMTPSKRTERQVEFFKRAYVFGHKDSRGGSTLVLARNHIEALRTYAQSFGADRDFHDAQQAAMGPIAYQEWRDSLIDACEEDFVGQYRLIVCDQGLPAEDGQELLESYGGPFQAAWVEERLDTEFGKMKWQRTDELVLYRGERPSLLPEARGMFNATFHFRLKDASSDLAEDEYGLILMRT